MIRTARIDDNLGRGTDGSNPVPSSSESATKLASCIAAVRGTLRVGLAFANASPAPLRPLVIALLPLASSF